MNLKIKHFAKYCWSWETSQNNLRRFKGNRNVSTSSFYCLYGFCSWSNYFFKVPLHNSNFTEYNNSEN